MIGEGHSIALVICPFLCIGNLYKLILRDF